jgi:hypothetical protein
MNAHAARPIASAVWNTRLKIMPGAYDVALSLIEEHAFSQPRVCLESKRPQDEHILRTFSG